MLFVAAPVLIALYYAQQNPGATNFFQTGSISAIVTAAVLGAYTLYKQVSASKLDRRKVTSDEFAEHRAFYEQQIARLETRALRAENDAMQARDDAMRARNEQGEMRTEIRDMRAEARARDVQVEKLMTEIKQLRIELGRPSV